MPSPRANAYTTTPHRRTVTDRPSARIGALGALGVLGLLAGAALSGCTTLGPDTASAPIDAPAQWADQHGGDASLAAPPSATAALPADRWAVFADATLQQLQAQALHANADVQTATLRLLQSRVEATTVRAQHGVQVGAKGALSRQRLSEHGSATRLAGAIGGANRQALIDVLSAPFTLAQAGFDASWEPDLWGRVLRSEEAADARTDAQQATLRQVQLGVRAEVARAYFALRAAQRQAVLTQAALVNAETTERLLAAQQAHGLADASAVIRQHSQVAALQGTLPSWQAQAAQATNRLTLLCGTTPGQLNALLATPAEPLATPPARPDLTLGLPAELARHRPDVAAAEARLHAATAGIGIAMADLYPRIVLGASFGLESVGTSQLGDWGSRQWSVSPSLSLPLFDHGRRRATVTLRQLQQQEAAVAFQQTVRQAWHDIDDAVATYRAETRRDAQLQARLRDSEAEARLARGRYESGLTHVLPVLGADAAVLAAQGELAQSGARVDTALVAVYKALGDDGPTPAVAGVADAQ